MLQQGSSGAAPLTPARDGPESAPRRLRLPPGLPGRRGALVKPHLVPMQLAGLRTCGLLGNAGGRQAMHSAGFRLLPDRGGIAFMIGLDEQRHGFDQGQVGECLREIAEMQACRGVNLLRVELERSGERQ